MTCSSRWSAALTALALSASALLVASPASAQPKDEARRGDVRLTKAPVLVEASEAEYTQEAIDARLEGDVQLKLTIDATGKVTKAEVISEPGAGLGEAARQAALKFVFEPAEINNVPSPVTLGFTITFELPILPSNFTGAVVDKTTGDGIPGATIAIKYAGADYDPPPEAQMTTEDDGKFAFREVPPGTYDVTLNVPAYEGFKTSIELVPGDTSEATYTIEASPETLSGTVRESGTRRTLAGISVQALNKDGEVVREEFTDATGRFGFRGLEDGTYSVRLSAEGYLSTSSDETVKAAELLTVEYYIEAEFYDEFTVRTTAKRKRKEVSRKTISLEEARRIPGTGGDVVRVVQNLPGVARSPFGTGLLVVRGANPQDSAVFLGGDELPLVFHFLGGPAVVNGEMINSIDFYPGNFSARYGRAIGGIIDLNTRSPRLDGFHGFAEVDIIDATAVVEAQITDDLSFALAGRRSYVDLFLNNVIPQDLFDILVSPSYYDYQGWLTYTGLPNHKLELFVYGSQDDLEVIFGEAQGNENFQFTGINQGVGFNRGQFRWEWRPNDSIESKFVAAVGTIGTTLRAGDFVIEGTNFTVNIREDLRVKLSDQITAKVGLDMQTLDGVTEVQVPAFGQTEPDNQTNPAADGFDSEIRLTQLQPAFYGELELSPVEGLLLIPGVRMDHYGTIRHTSISPRFAGRYQLTKEFVAKGGIGLFTQPPTAQQVSPFAGNPDLLPESAIHYALGAEWRPLEFLEFDVTGFYRDTYDLVASSTAFEIDEDTGEATPEFFNNDGLGRSYGLEVLARHYPNNRFFGWISYTLSRSERLDLDTNEYVVFGFDQTHILTTVAGYNFPYNIDVSLRFQYVTGTPFTPIIGGAFDVEDDNYEQISGEPNSRRNPAFNQLDLRIDKRWVYDTWMFGIFLDVQNVYNAANQEAIQYNFDFSESQPVSGLPILPSLGINAKW